MKNNIAALILAAGYSSRMGSLKALLPLGEHTVIIRLINAMYNSGINDVYVVTGYHGNEIEAYLYNSSITLLHNPFYNRGMFSSVLTGIKAIACNSYDGFVISPVDYPLLSGEIIRTLLQSFSSGKYPVVYPVYQGEKGHPPVISTKCISSILSYNGENGLKGALAPFAKQALYLPVTDIAVVTDMDTPEDYHRILSMANIVIPPRNLFLQGDIGAGKSTLIQEAIAPYHEGVEGFYVRRQMNRSGVCTAFSLRDVNQPPRLLEEEHHGDSGIFLAQSGARWQYFPEVFETLGVEILQKAVKSRPALIILDEAGGLESTRPAFRQSLQRVLKSGIPCLGVFKQEKNTLIQRRFLPEEYGYDNARSELVSDIFQTGGQILTLASGNSKQIRKQVFSFVSQAMEGFNA